MVHPCDKPCGNKASSGYCATTACINPKYSNIGTAHYGQGVQKAIITNADRIRAMSDEELADYFSELSCWPNAGREDCRGMANCMDCWLDWLKQEASE